MELIIFEKDSYYKLMEETMSLMYKVIKNQVDSQKVGIDDADDFITTNEAMKLLGIKSRNRLYELRNDPKQPIDYFQHGRRILYSKKSIINFIKGQQVI